MENPCLLITLQHKEMTDWQAKESLEELASLVDTMGFDVAHKKIVKLRSPNPRFLMGNGKAEEIAFFAKDEEVDFIIFDDELTPSQQRNWENLTDITTIDRHEVILDIFSNRAHTKEASLQIELARLEYMIPRLKRAWTHLHRQRGGAKGTKGEGEKQIELDRRIILQRIAKLKKELLQVRSQRATMRKQRRSIPVPTGAIVGYTNAGKSSLLKKLTGAEILVEDKLFATLDPTTRKIPIANGLEVLLTDTVGFIQKLPHDLVEAFKSTLEETVLSDFLIHVVDSSSEAAIEQIKTTEAVLAELGASGKETILVFNKIDLLDDSVRHTFLHTRFPQAVHISTHTGDGMDKLLEKIASLVTAKYQHRQYHIPHSRYDLVALLHTNRGIVREDHTNSGIDVYARVPSRLRKTLEPFEVQ